MKKIAALVAVVLAVGFFGCSQNPIDSKTEPDQDAQFFIKQAVLEGSEVRLFNLLISDTALPGVSITSFGDSTYSPYLFRFADSAKYYYRGTLVTQMSDRNGGGVSCWGGMINNTPVILMVNFAWRLIDSVWQSGGITFYGGKTDVFLGNKKILSTLYDALENVCYVPGDIGRGIKEKIVMIESVSRDVLSESGYFEVYYYDFSADTTCYVGQTFFPNADLRKSIAR